MFIRKIGNGYYWYETKKRDDKIISIYRGKATPQEVRKYYGFRH